MSNVHYLKTSHIQRPARFSRPSARRKLNVDVRIIDRQKPKHARWMTQFAIQRTAGYSALKGFTDSAAMRHLWHSFQLDPRLEPRFKREMLELVTDGRVDLRIDGQKIIRTPRIRRAV
jgi:hypothetical protein